MGRAGMIELVKEWHWMVSWPLILSGALFGLMFTLKVWEKPRDRAAMIRWLENGAGKAMYRTAMQRLLRRIDWRLSFGEKRRGKGAVQVAWSADLASLLLLFSVTYPIAAFLSHWFAGKPLMLGDLELAPAGTKEARGFAFLWYLSTGVCFFFAFRNNPKPKWHWFIGAFATLFSGLYFAADLGVPSATYGIALFVVPTAVATRLGGAIAGSISGPLAVASAFAVTGMVDVSDQLVTALIALISVLISFVFAILVAKVVRRIEKKNNIIWHTGIFFSVIAQLILLMTVLILFPKEPIGAGVIYLILFLGIFPFFNAIADFASIGLTRYLLRKGLSGWTLKHAILDAFGGVIIFALLGISLISYIHLVRPPDGRMLLDLTGVFAGLQCSLSDYWWLGFMLLSTLLPTLLHLAIGIFTGFLGWLPGWRGQIVAWLRAGGGEDDADGEASDLQGMFAIAALSGLAVASLWLPVLGFYALFRLDHGWLLDRVVGFFHGYARLIGAV